MTVVEVAVLVLIWTAAVGLLVARTAIHRWAAMVALFAAQTVRAWSHHEGTLWVATFAVIAAASLAALLWSRRTTSGK